MRREIKKIFCATDFSEFAKDVIVYGLILAKEFSAKLYVCHVVDLPSVPSYGKAVAGSVEQQKRFMDYARRQIKRMVTDESVEHIPIVTLGNTTEEISRLVKEHQPDLVITATYGKSELKRFFLGSVTERLLQTLPCPLLVLRAAGKGPQSKRQKFPFKRVLVGCDFSPDSINALNYVLGFAQEFKIELHLIHIVEPTGYETLFKLPSAPREKFKKELFEMIEKKLHSVVAEKGLNGLNLSTQLVVGKPYEQLIQYAKNNNIDLIALGTRGLGMVEEILVGSTTDRVVRRAPCPVLSIPLKFA